MKKVPFEPPTEYYDENLLQIDEQICALFKQRKEISDKNPGFPPSEKIADWAKKYGLYEELLQAIFGELRNEEHFRPYVEPERFRKYVSILKSVEKGECMYTISFMRQFENASVINLIIDWESEKFSQEDRFHRHTFWELVLGDQYDCRMSGGGGSDGHLSYNFIVSPSLPDDLSGIDLVFKEFKTPFKDKPTGIEIAFHMY
ncbi:hypothetical protein BIV60_27435 [Bacillus sp. MUM 116]|uniref:hypothetical protein n=1 Tax=Bacillus sp. MUM 116 TaxID=1678002 RepID=UPI0008F5DA77|nr:hypothetical protein [Bacillus sp. MUM 116]OIK06058.1 hypothetical protein BIV60_27435 [Bacillus sp. MUM 116]